MTEEELIAGLIRADKEAHYYCFKKFKNKVYNTAMGVLHHVEDAEDITQEVFLKIFDSVKDFKHDSKLSTWIYRITVNKCLDFIKAKKSKKRFAFITSLFGSESAEPIYDKPDFNHPGILLENKEKATMLFAAIDKLPESQKTAFVLQKNEQLNQAEIAEVMKLSVGAVESLLQRAKTNLRKSLESMIKTNSI